MVLRKTHGKDVNWIKLDQDWTQWKALVLAALKIWVLLPDLLTYSKL